MMPEASAPRTAGLSGDRPEATRAVRSAVCTRCGCACDDIDLTVAGGRIVEARNACELGRPWFLRPLEEEAPPALVEGRAATFEEGAAAAAGLLAAARRPLVWGLIHLACEAQRLAVEIAERLRGVIDPAAGPNHAAAVTAFAEWGEVGTTLGEVAAQRGLVVLWLAEPSRTQPRLLRRWGIHSDDDERLIRIRHGAADESPWSLPPGRELELLWILRELARRRALEGAGESFQAPGAAQELAPLASRLLERLAAARYAVLAFDAAAADPAQQHALRALAATLNGLTRFRLFPLRDAGNRTGAEAVLTWQTGFPIAVDFASGTPRANGGEFSAARLLARGEVDACLAVCANPAELPSEPAFARLGEVPLVVLDSEPNPLSPAARVALRSAPYGLASGGTFFRSDGISLGLRPALSSRYPTETQWLARILAHLPAPAGASSSSPPRSAS